MTRQDQRQGDKHGFMQRRGSRNGEGQTRQEAGGRGWCIGRAVDLLLVGIEAHALVDDLIASFAPDVKGRLEADDITTLRLQFTVDLRATVAPALAAKAE